MPEMNNNDHAIFVDTNVLVYANLEHSPFYPAAEQRLNDLSIQGHTLWISRQILREYLATMTRGNIVDRHLLIKTLLDDVHYFSEHFHLAEDSEVVTANLLTLMEQIPMGGAQVHDANFIATMQVYGISKLLTHNTKDFERFAGLITVLPLIESIAPV
jgi:predicted nucleic acid-binding protein